MKKLFLFAFILLSVCAGKVMAQNIQLHYDLGRALYKSLEERDRPWGDYNGRDVQGRQVG